MGLTAKVLGGFLLMGLIAVVFAAVGFSSTPSASAYKDFQTEIDNAQTEAQNGGATLKFDASSGSSTLATLTDGVLDIGGVEARFNVGWPNLAVYLRRDARDFSVVEVELAIHDGLEEEELEMLNMDAERYPLRPKEYWRSKMVGRHTPSAPTAIR